VKVALIGQGPDELFAGYRRHFGVRYGGYWGTMPNWIRDPIALGIAALPRNEALKRGIHSLKVKERLRRYQNVLSLLPGKEIDALFQDGMLERDAGDKILECWKDLIPLMGETDELGGLQFLEMRSTLPDELLMFGDKLSMAHGLELRVPYLDKDLVEYIERLPASFKVRNGTQKWLHRQVCQNILPKAILKRRKRGFAVNVVDDWFRGSVSGKIDEILMDGESRMYRYLRPSAVQRMFKQHQSGQNDHHKILFSLVVFEEWLRVQLSSGTAMDSALVSTQ
jgi:asparagine synthase (glutamine-hydrolysing)